MVVANTISVAADLGAMAALRLQVPVPFSVAVIGIAGLIVALQILGSYTLIRTIFRWLAMVLLAYVAARACRPTSSRGSRTRRSRRRSSTVARAWPHARAQPRRSSAARGATSCSAGAACAIAQTFGWRHGISKRFHQVHHFYAAIIGLTAIAGGLDFAGIDPVRALVWSGVAQGLTTPILLLITLMLTNSRAVMGDSVNGRALRICGVVTTLATVVAAVSFGISWFL